MFVLINSATENHKSIKKVNSVLDRYAIRVSQDSWQTRITEEGLVALRNDLMSIVNKNVSISCSKNYGFNKLKLLWVVGNKNKFNSFGQQPVFLTKILRRNISKDDYRIKTKFEIDVCDVSLLAGYYHDIGKNNVFFAKKILSKTPIADPVRHELFSFYFLLLIFEQFDIDKKFKNFSSSEIESLYFKTFLKLKNVYQNEKFQPNDYFNNLKISSFKDAVLISVLTHHRLPEDRNKKFMDVSSYIRAKEKRTYKGDEDNECFVMAGGFSENFIDKFNRVTHKLYLCFIDSTDDHEYWKGVVILSRSFLILADHKVSSIPLAKDGYDKNNESVFANTEIDNKSKIRTLKQPLAWHLRSVGELASNIAHGFFENYRTGSEFEYLNRASILNANKPAVGRFKWQEDASSCLIEQKKINNAPSLIFLISGTGSGKTRACFRFVTNVSISNDKCRITTLLNLRTLTTQTYDVYKNQVGINENYLTMLIGNMFYKTDIETAIKGLKHGIENEEYQENEDEMIRDIDEEDSDYYDFVGGKYNIPNYINLFATNKKKNLEKIIGSPVLVATADYLVNAGDFSQQGRHSLLLNRVMSSDFILDEIDSYDSRSIFSMLRVVFLIGFFGRSIVLSSATISSNLAKMIYEAYNNGYKIFKKVNNCSTEFNYSFISDKNDFFGAINDTSNTERFGEDFNFYTNTIIKNLENEKNVYRMADIKTFEMQSCLSFMEYTKESVIELHNKNKWTDTETGKKISIGLVRLANTKTVVNVANVLRRDLQNLNVRVLSYHANKYIGERALIEKYLDEILVRKNNMNPAFNNEIKKHLKNESADEFLFIVVATPVEEIGRDHDFDWAVIEPSSSQSIVQTAGRVNRHRLLPVTDVNIILLQYNYLFCKNVDAGRREDFCFVRPGNENDSVKYEHDLKKLINYNGHPFNVDGRIKFDTSKNLFASLDDKSYHDENSKAIKYFFDTEYCMMYMCNSHYKAYRLRDIDNNQFILSYDPESFTYYHVRKCKNKNKLEKYPLKPNLKDSVFNIEENNDNLEFHFLYFTLDEITGYADNLNLKASKLLTATINIYNKKIDTIKIIRSMDGFGIE